MAEIEITIQREDVFDEVEKATDYTGSKMVDSDQGARARILAVGSDLATLDRFWVDGAHGVNERLKNMVVSSTVDIEKYTARLDVSVSFDTVLKPSVEKSIRSFFIDFIIGEWFKFTNKGESEGYFATAEEYLTNAERLLYSRKKPKRPVD
ncbi:MAG: hypothetical protein J1D77_03700 [Muribaculaceae bacterium]|nr:hypothetical protein [Muribaculaceae bacterium]